MARWCGSTVAATQGLAGGNCAGNLRAVTPQPFFETALNPAYCAGYASCTAGCGSQEGVGKQWQRQHCHSKRVEHLE